MSRDKNPAPIEALLKLWFNENESPLHVQWGSIMEEYTKKDGASAQPESQFIQIKGAFVPTFIHAY